KIGRPLADVDPEQVRALASIGCTMEEIASQVGCGLATLDRRFGKEISLGRENAKTSLRRMMYKSANAGSVPMQIWLSKQWLGMTEPAKVQMFGEEVARIGGFTPAEFERETISLILEKVQQRITRGDSEKKP
ncbi:MAG TPA: hypothetical protein VMY37_17770, partial [Thermoguttaceae bacterium]|nr:hypothetical protein [Thermoguttaceae bacterium]